MHTGHSDRALEIELGLIIFFRDRIVALNGDRAQRLAASRDSVSDGKVVAKVHDRKQDESDRQYTQLHWQQDDDFEVRGEKSSAGALLKNSALAALCKGAEGACAALVPHPHLAFCARLGWGFFPTP